MKNTLRNTQLGLVVTLLIGVCLHPLVGLAQTSSHQLASDQQELFRQRALRRESSRQFHARPDKIQPASSFALLVIPVDFSDHRLPDNWQADQALAPRLFGDEGHTMENFYNVAAGGLLDLQITLAPLVHLSGERNDYSDVGWNGFSRTRALATESIAAVAAQGMEFRRLDLDGPDGMVDGVLILHSAIGQENDPEDGRIQALQFFIDPPINSGGVGAAFYAVASQQSGLGIWAHETGHLLGMEDRYDPLLHPETGGADVRSLGGLGRFSLMSSGAWGTGDGLNPALPDAYSCLQMGWIAAPWIPEQPHQPTVVGPWRDGGTTPRVWTDGRPGTEFFLMETRDPAQTYPFDAGIPAGQMLIYHVDETVPDGWFVSEGGGDYHLRVRLVEADDDQALAAGDDDGRAEDLFPGPLFVDSLTPQSSPSSWGYSGASKVQLLDIQSEGSSVHLNVLASDSHVIDLLFDWENTNPAPLDLQVQSRGLGFLQLSCEMHLSGEGGGQFPGGGQDLTVEFVESEGHWIPATDVFIEPPPTPIAGAVTELEFRFDTGDDFPSLENRSITWLPDAGIFDFHHPDWEFWTRTYPSDELSTAWMLWDQPPYLTADQTPVLVCLDTDHDSAADWPEVSYANNAWTAMISPPLEGPWAAVQLTHAIEVEHLHAGSVMDGATAFWQGADGTLVPAMPVDGWQAGINPSSNNPLGGAGAFADSLLVLDSGNHPQWQSDILPLPDAPGPWQLRLEFASNALWRDRGWIIARMDPLTTVPASAFPIAWHSEETACGSGLVWSLPEAGGPYSNPVVQSFDPDLLVYEELPGQSGQIETCQEGFSLASATVLSGLSQLGLHRNLLRVVADGSCGKVASRGIVVYPDGGPQSIGFLEQPFPNPSLGALKFLVEIPPGDGARLKVFDLRGRLVYSRDLAAGRQQIFWSGSDQSGRRLASGNYYLRLEGSGLVQTRKVVLVR